MRRHQARGMFLPERAMPPGYRQKAGLHAFFRGRGESACAIGNILNTKK